jgi:methionine--tRNA ligase beta chain
MTVEEFQNVDLRIGKIIAASRVDQSEKLLKLEVDMGDDPSMVKRQIIAGIGKAYAPKELLGKQIVVVANLEPRKFTLRSDSGQVVLESQGMLLAAHDENDNPVILTVERVAKNGSKIK